MLIVDCRTESEWLEQVLDAVRIAGCAIVRNVLPPDLIETLRGALYQANAEFRRVVGDQRLERAGERGVIRLPMLFAPQLFQLLELPEVLAVVDRTVSETAVLHLQNGFGLPSAALSDPNAVFQHRFHQDFPRVLNGYLASINTLFTLSDFSAGTGATLVVPGSQQRMTRPSEAYLHRAAVSAACPAGSMIVFDSTLWHAAGMNTSGQDRLAVNQQFTRSFFKQQFDYCRALGESIVRAQAPRTQQLLGYYTRIPTSLDEYYVPAEHRLYRAGQG